VVDGNTPLVRERGRVGVDGLDDRFGVCSEVVDVLKELAL